jgi:hypothetical protein
MPGATVENLVGSPLAAPTPGPITIMSTGKAQRTRPNRRIVAFMLPSTRTLLQISGSRDVRRDGEGENLDRLFFRHDQPHLLNRARV